MADPFVAEIRMVGFNFPPRGWATCNGQLMPISQNTALFALLGTTYGGNGMSTFALPDLQGRTPMHTGQGQGLSLRDLGESGGTESVTLLESEIPSHSHQLRASSTIGDTPLPTGNAPARYAETYHPGPPTADMAPQSLAAAGADVPHDNVMPSLALNFIIALQGVFPPRQ